MKLSASVYSNPEKPLEELIRELDQFDVDYFHIDCIDDPKIIEDMPRIAAISKTPLDVHLITHDPNPYLMQMDPQLVSMVCLQLENLHQVPVLPEGKWQRGLALTSETPLEYFAPHAAHYDFVLLMTTTPGQSGGRFDSRTFKRIRRFRNMFPDKKIHVDGGVNDEVSFILRNMGVDLVVSGSYLVKADSIAKAVISLRHADTESHYYIREFMIPAEELPVIGTDADFLQVLMAIEESQMGFGLVTDRHNKLAGIVSNADIRRGLIRRNGKTDGLNLNDILNHKPVTIGADQNVTEMLQKIKSLSFPVLYLPVTEADGSLAGAVKFHNLIKGEL